MAIDTTQTPPVAVLYAAVSEASAVAIPSTQYRNNLIIYGDSYTATPVRTAT